MFKITITLIITSALQLASVECTSQTTGIVFSQRSRLLPGFVAPVRLSSDGGDNTDHNALFKISSSSTSASIPTGADNDTGSQSILNMMGMRKSAVSSSSRERYSHVRLFYRNTLEEDDIMFSAIVDGIEKELRLEEHLLLNSSTSSSSQQQQQDHILIREPHSYFVLAFSPSLEAGTLEEKDIKFSTIVDGIQKELYLEEQQFVLNSNTMSNSQQHQDHLLIREPHSYFILAFSPSLEGS